MFAGSASKPPTEEAIKTFEQKTGIKVDVVYGGSGKVLSQMKLAKEGDLYFPGSSDYMEKAKKDGNVIPETEEHIAYVVPAINVQAGNPKNIQTLADLTKPGLKLAIANPESVCVGLYAVEIIENDLTASAEDRVQGEPAELHRQLRAHCHRDLPQASGCRARLERLPGLGRDEDPDRSAR